MREGGNLRRFGGVDIVKAMNGRHTNLTCVVLTGAGISAESGVKTFRDAGGLWEGTRPEDVATPEAWEADPEKVLRFYNMRRDQLRSVQPNAAHRALVELESVMAVHIITQNVDDLHERAGSRQVLHLHGELMQARSVVNSHYIVDLGEASIALGDTCPKGGQLRPNVVWFGEAVPAIPEAIGIVQRADILLVIGTSLQVYPAAGLIDFAPGHCRKVIIDPKIPEVAGLGFEAIPENAVAGVPKCVKSQRG